MTVEDIAARLIAQQKRVSVAEADTCGLIGYMLSTVPGSSQYFPGGVIAYTGGLKQKILGVSDELYQTKGTVSPEMAIAMAKGVRDLTGTDYGISVTGVAGPSGGRSGLPVGTFYVGLVGPNGSKWRNGFTPMRESVTATSVRPRRRPLICLAATCDGAPSRRTIRDSGVVLRPEAPVNPCTANLRQSRAEPDK